MTTDRVTPMAVSRLTFTEPSIRNFWTYRATTPFGTYFIERERKHWRVTLEGPAGSEERIGRPVRCVWQARDIAQGDFEARTFALLVPASAEPPEPPARQRPRIAPVYHVVTPQAPAPYFLEAAE